MADPVLRLEPSRLSVEPGSQVSLVLTVNNPGVEVQGYSIDVVSTVPMPWARVEPATLTVYPHQEGTAVVAFAPPAGPTAPGGTFPFGVRVWSQIEGGGSAVAEGDLEVGSVSGLQARLSPVASTGRWRGRHALTISNWGNAPARLRLTATDPEHGLGFLVSPEIVDVPLGAEATSRIKVRTRHPSLRGTPRRMPFQVVCEPQGAATVAGPTPVGSTPGRPVVDGVFNQKPILTRGVVAIAGMLLLAAIGGVAYALLRDDPQVDGEAATNPGTPSGFRAVDTASPTEITLVWDEMPDVDGFRITNYDPALERFGPPQDAGDATMAVVELPPSTAMCFTLTAYRGELESAPTEQTCSETEPEGTAEPPPPADQPSPTVTLTPSMEPEPSPPVGSGDPNAPPLDFISVLEAASVETEARDIQQRYAEAGVAVKVLFTSDYGLVRVLPSPPPTSPPPPLWVVYVDGASAADAAANCAAVQATLGQAGQPPPGGSCLIIDQVLARPDTLPSPTAQPSPSV